MFAFTRSLLKRE